MKRSKIYTTALLALLIAVTAVFLLPTKGEASTSGDYTYSVSNSNATITDYTGSAAFLSIPTTLGGYPVTCIGNSAFRDCTSIKSITIPNSVTSIDVRAFRGCTSLASIAIPDSVTNIDNQAFYNCTSLNTVTLGNSVTNIGSYAFSGCTSLTSFATPDSVISIGEYAFYTCNALTTVTIGEGNGITSIGASVFRECRNLKSVTLGNGISSIGEYAFYHCDRLANINIPDSVTSIGDSAFYCCYDLTSITIPDSVTSLGNNAFRDCQNMQSATIGNGVTSIGEYAFSYCSDLTSITIGSSVTSIGYCAFASCSSLTNITLPDSVTTIGNNAFNFCENLKRIDIGSGITSIGYYAFSYCPRLTDVYYAGSSDQWQSVRIDSTNTVLTTAMIHYHTHDYSSAPPVTADPTCTEEGYTEYTCACGDQFRTDYIPALGHLQGALIQTVPPTCTQQGYSQFQCTRCSEAICAEWTDIIPHDYTGPEKTIEPTCTADGSSGHTCIRCGAYQAEQTFPALGHISIIVDRKEPNCVKDGNTAGTWCSRCQQYLSQPEVIPALGHLEVIDPAVLPTCTKTGLTEGKHCSRCLLPLVPQQIIDALGHYVLQGSKEMVDSYTTQNDATYAFAVVDGWYESTNKKSNTTSIYIISALYDCTLVLRYKVSSEQNYDKLQILVNSTIKDTISGTVSEKIMSLNLKAGDRVYIKYSKDSSVSRNADTGYFKINSCTQTELDNTVRVSTDDIEPTCGQGVVCADCKQTVKEATDRHSYSTTVTEPTCVDQGYTTYTCHCGDTYVGTYVAANGHSWSDWSIQTAASCAAAGFKDRTCHCGAYEQVTIEVLPHTFENEACAICRAFQNGSFTLPEDVEICLALTEDLYINLNGFDLSGTIRTNGFKVYGTDITTDSYCCDNVGFFSCADELGNPIVPERICNQDEKQYLSIYKDEKYSFHRFFVGVTHMSLEPEVIGLGYKSAIYGDEMVMADLADSKAFTFQVRLEGYKPVYRYFNSDELNSGDPITLRIRNYDVENYSEHTLYAQVSLTLDDGTVIETEQVALTFRWLAEQVNANFQDYTGTQLSDFKKLLEQFEVVKTWNLPILFPVAAASATLNLSDAAYRLSQTSNQQVWSANGLTLTNNKYTSSTSVSDYVPIRLYTSSQVIIDFVGMTRLEFDCTNISTKYVQNLYESLSAITNATVMQEGNLMIVVLSAPVDSLTFVMTAQARVVALTVYQ